MPWGYPGRGAVASAGGQPLNRPTPGSSRALREALVVAGATVACLLPFANKALHIDDHRYVQMAQQIQRDPLDFYGFEVNLGGSAQPEVAVANNPPGVAFYLALAALVTGWSERGLHLALLLPALAATLGTWALGRGLCRDPVLAGLLCLSCPVFLVSATTVMADVSMTALFCWSLWFWRRGLVQGRRSSLWLGAVLAALCALTKYFGIALLPLLAAYSLYRERRLGSWLGVLLLPLAALVVFELYTAHAYGVSPILRAAGYSVSTRTGETGGLERVLVAIVFVGGALFSLLFFAPLAFSRRWLAGIGGLAAGLLVIALAHGRLAGVALSLQDANLVVHVAIFALAGVALFALLAAELYRDRSPDALLLVLWALGAFAFATVVNYTTNGRTLLALAPPVALLLVRRLDGRVPPLSRVLRYAPLAPALALALAVAWGDAALAGASRTAARRIGAAHASGPGTLWFDGGWGFQHYMAEAGGRAVDVRRHVLRPGDRLASSGNWKLRLRTSPRAASVLETFEIPLPAFTTMLEASGTGFYAIQWGPLPFRWLPGMSEGFEVRRLEHLVIFEDDASERERRAAELARAAHALAPLLALRASGWPDLVEDADDREARAEWQRCEPELERLGTEASVGCVWCATVQQCAECVGIAAAGVGLTASCARQLEASGAALSRRCTMPGSSADLGCQAARSLERWLRGEAGPPAFADPAAPPAARRSP